MNYAIYHGNVGKVRRLLDSGEDENGVVGGITPIMTALYHGNMSVVRLLHERGADLSMVTDNRSNTLHIAARGGDVECINYVLANTTIDVNSTNNHGTTPIRYALAYDKLDAAKLLVEKGANLFKKNNGGLSVMDHFLGPQVLQHAKDLRFDSVKQFLFLSKSFSIDTTQYDSNPPQRRSSRLEAPLISAHRIASVFGNPYIAEILAEYLLDTTCVVRNPSIPLPLVFVVI
jgi:ankyrin repeat protein